MPRLPLVLAALTAATLLGTGASRAEYQGPWCARYAVGRGAVAERCHFQSFEACLVEITGGNRGFCNNNPRWSGQLASQAPKRKASRKRHRH